MCEKPCRRISIKPQTELNEPALGRPRGGVESWSCVVKNSGYPGISTSTATSSDGCKYPCSQAKAGSLGDGLTQ